MNITFTGVDVRTDIWSLPLDYEFGVLYTETPEGRNRYPARDDVMRILDTLNRSGHKSALHVCGRRARQEILSQRRSDVVQYCDRIQINGQVEPDELLVFCRRFSDHTIITQHTIANLLLLEAEIENHAILVDGSGGRGISPAAWIRPTTNKEVGFAGGLGPDNIVAEFLKIRTVATGKWWIDMEGKLRDENDWLVVERIYQVIERLL